MDVVDGEDIAVLSQGHLVKVKLLGVACPAKDQAYAGIARQHLSDLILDKYVMVRYSALRDGYIVGQVLLESMDVGAQMLRDGVGWYNKADETLLGEIERQVYEKSQGAARNERRGLWQENSPVPPWEFRRSQLAAPPAPAKAKVATYTPPLEHLPRLPTGPRRSTQAGFSNEDFLGGMVGPGSVAGKPEIKQLSPDGTPGRWMRYQPANKTFSILVPSDGLEITVPVIDGQGGKVDLHYVSGNSGTTVYFLLWAKGPNGNSTDESAADDAIKGIVNGFNQATALRGGFAVSATPGRGLKLTGYTGRQYALDLGPVSAVVRVLSKQVGNERDLFLLCVMSAANAEPAGDDFFNSFRVR